MCPFDEDFISKAYRVIVTYYVNKKRKQDLLNLLGAMFAAVVFLGGINSSIVLFVVAIERIVFYREKAAGMYSALPYVFGQVKKSCYIM